MYFIVVSEKQNKNLRKLGMMPNKKKDFFLHILMLFHFFFTFSYIVIENYSINRHEHVSAQIHSFFMYIYISS